MAGAGDDGGDGDGTCVDAGGVAIGSAVAVCGGVGEGGAEGGGVVGGGGSVVSVVCNSGSGMLMDNAVVASQVSRRISSSSWRELDCCVAVEPRFLARTAALWLAREAVSIALARLVGRVLALVDLSTLARAAAVLTTAAGGADSPVPGVAAAVSTTGSRGVVGGDAAGAVAVAEGNWPSPASLLSSRLLRLLSLSLLLLPVCSELAASLVVETSPFPAGLNQKQTSSDTPSVSNTSLAGTPILLHRNHAMN